VTTETTSTTKTAAPQDGATSRPATGRADAFRAEMNALRIRDPRSRLDGALLRVGIVGMAAGPVIAIIAYFISHTTTNPLQQRDAIVLGTLAISITLVGVALFLRYSLTAFLRFWIARLLFDRQQPGA
jgi:hypothetical protein